MEATPVPLLDPTQLVRIEGVHRGFLYQHLYAVECLLLASRSGASSIIVERDEDTEIVFPHRRIYVQIKTRSEPLTWSDIAGAMERFDALRIEHREQRRAGSASFVIATNSAPGPQLLARMNHATWPSDVTLLWPGKGGPVDSAVPLPQPSVNAALASVCGIAETLPYARLAPETLVYKLAGAVMAASAGNPPRADHAFQVWELPSLFEQLVVQLQDFPSPPTVYRSHVNEPALHSSQRIRIVTGFSGAGKTSWVSQAAVHVPGTAIYIDLTETPGPVLAATVARELGARLFGQAGGQLGDVLLPGATGAEMLNTIGARLADSGGEVTVVLDNVHRIPSVDIQNLIAHARNLKFLLLCQPGRSITELEALFGIAAEPLRGWETDSVALEVAAQGCRGDYTDCQRLRDLTAGMPLYVQNAITIAATTYEGSIRRFCDEIEAKTHIVETAQELILVRAFSALPDASRNGVAVLSLSDIPLERTDAAALLVNALAFDERAAASLLRQIRSSGFVEVYGGSKLKIHDAMRLLGSAHLETLGNKTVRSAQTALKSILAASLEQEWDISKLSLYLRMLAATGDVKGLVELGTDELFHELGVEREILAFLEQAAASENTAPADRFWALDGLLFADLKAGNSEKASEHADTMSRILDQHELGVDERLALAMKRMNMLAMSGDAEGVATSMAEVSSLLPAAEAHQRIFRYNAAHALHNLGRHEEAIVELGELIQEYYELLGISLEDVFGRNPDTIWPKIRRGGSHIDHLKHLADSLDLQAAAITALGEIPRFQRIHAVKFYQMASAIDSIFRVGKDLVDEFVARNDFIGARQVIETNLLPNVLNLKVLSQIVPVRSQYAVILAYCGDFDAADAEMKRLDPYQAGLDLEGQLELNNQRRLIAEIRRNGPPPQWTPLPTPHPTMLRHEPKIGRNSPCHCGSGKKFKICHGRRA